MILFISGYFNLMIEIADLTCSLGLNKIIFLFFCLRLSWFDDLVHEFSKLTRVFFMFFSNHIPYYWVDQWLKFIISFDLFFMSYLIIVTWVTGLTCELISFFKVPFIIEFFSIYPWIFYPKKIRLRKFIFYMIIIVLELGL